LSPFFGGYTMAKPKKMDFGTTRLPIFHIRSIFFIMDKRKF
jgi:hypothetical protein